MVFCIASTMSRRPQGGNLARNWQVMDIKMNTPSSLGYASLSISDPEKWGRLSAKAKEDEEVGTLGHRETGFISSWLRSVPTPGQSRSWDTRNATPCIPTVSKFATEKGLTKRHALYLSTIAAFLALLTSHYPLSTFDVEVNAFGSIATLHITDRFLWVSLLDEMSHERLVPDRTPLRPRKCL